MTGHSHSDARGVRPFPRRSATGVYHGAPAVLLGREIRVATMLGYDPTEDPWAVTIAFRSRNTEWVRWTLARELLAAGLLMPAGGGAGDVTVAPTPTGAVLIGLSNSREYAEFRFNGDHIAEFLADSYQAVPLGAERLDWPAETRLLELLDVLDDDGGA